MKLVFVAITFSVVLLARADEASEDDKELTECGNKFAEKVVALSGDFLDKDEILEVSYNEKNIFIYILVTSKSIRHVLQREKDATRNQRLLYFELSQCRIEPRASRYGKKLYLKF
jgi:hypothetical protein